MSRSVDLGRNDAFIFNGPTNLQELQDLDLSGVHLHFNGPFDLEDLTRVDLRNTTIIINDYRGIPPCSNCGKSLIAQDYQENALATTSMTQTSIRTNTVADRRPHKRTRTSESTEEGEIRTPSPTLAASNDTVAPQIHPARLKMLSEPTPISPPRTLQPTKKTKANRIDMPFNRLDKRQHHQDRHATTAGGSSGSIRDTPSQTGPKNIRRGSSSESEHFDRVDNFLDSLEAVAAGTLPQSPSYGRLSPMSCTEPVQSLTPSVALSIQAYTTSTPAPLEVQSKPQNSVLFQRDVNLRPVVKIEQEM